MFATRTVISDKSAAGQGYAVRGGVVKWIEGKTYVIWWKCNVYTTVKHCYQWPTDVLNSAAYWMYCDDNWERIGWPSQVEMIVSTSICGAIYALTCGQPVALTGFGGAHLAFTGVLYRYDVRGISNTTNFTAYYLRRLNVLQILSLLLIFSQVVSLHYTCVTHCSSALH